MRLHTASARRVDTSKDKKFSLPTSEEYLPLERYVIKLAAVALSHIDLKVLLPLYSKIFGRLIKKPRPLAGYPQKYNENMEDFASSSILTSNRTK